MSTVMRYLRPHLGRMSLGFLIKVVGTIIELFLPYLLSSILDDCAAVGDVAGAWLRGGLMVLCALLALTFNVIANRMACGVSRCVTRTLRQDLYDRTERLSCAQVDRFTQASLMSRLTSDTYNVHQMVDRMQRLGVRAPIMLVGGICVAMSLDAVMALVLVATLPLLTLVMVLISRKGIPLYEKSQRSLDRLVRKVQENMTGARVIKALSKVDYERDRFDQVNQDNVACEARASRVMALTTPLMNLMLNLGLAAVVVVGALRVQSGLAQPGAIIAFLSYFTLILNALMMVSRLFTLYSKGAASAARISEVLSAPAELGGAPMQTEPASPAELGEAPVQTETASPAELGGAPVQTETASPASPAAQPPAIAFADVSFSYNKRQMDLRHITFALPAGKTLGIIGPTGSGKTTLLSLLMRFYDADEGRVLLGGRDVRVLTEQELRRKVGVVQQSDYIMSDTVLENVRFGREVPLPQAEEAARVAQAEFIARLASGFDTPLTARGTNLSGGQKQRVLITRALAGRPELLLLDDCSSALDYRTDALLRRALREHGGLKATVIVAQRVSSVMDCDLILLLDEGNQVGLGTHGELLRACPAYAELCRLQLGGAAPAGREALA